MKTIFKKIGVGLTLIVFMSVTFGSPIVQGYSNPDNYDLVALLVEQGMYQDVVNYSGLVGSVQSNKISVTTNTSRIDRYAMDVQRTLPGTRVVIIQVDRYEKPENVRTVLQRLYFDGDPQADGALATLKGIVAIGEVPLPVVNKGGNRFISLFPYTDLENSAYVFNDKTGDFELNANVSDPRVEVWHGVIRPPVSTQTEDGRKLLAAYLDKNHLYHSGDQAFSKFDSRLFFQDYYNEKKQINKTAYTSYLQFINHQDDISYMRYTKKLFNELSGSVDSELADAGQQSADLRTQLQAAGVPFDDSSPSSGVELPGSGGEVDKNAIPDIMTKIAKMSDSLMKKYNEIFSKYPSLVNDFVRYTGRYYVPDTSTDDVTDYKTNADSSVNLIAEKDEYNRVYLRLVNDMIERKIDEISAQLQLDVSLSNANVNVKSVSGVGGVRVEPYSTSGSVSDAVQFVIDRLKTAISTLPLGDIRDNTIKAAKTAFNLVFFSPETPADGDRLSYSKNYLNYSPKVGINDAAYFSKFFPTYPLDDDTGTKAANINGVQWDDINSVEQCSLYRGSLGAGEYSNLVEANRANNINTAQESAADNLEDHGGCYYDGTNLYAHPDTTSGYKQCYPDDSRTPVLDLAGSIATDAVPFTGYDDYRACLNFRPEYEMYKERIAVDQIHEKLDDRSQDRKGRDRDKILETVRPMIDGGLDIPFDGDPSPDQQVLFKSKSPRYSVTLGDVLRSTEVGWSYINARDSHYGDWRYLFEKMITAYSDGRNHIVHVTNTVLTNAAVVISISKNDEKHFSSIRVHKEPTKPTLIAEGDGFVTKDLPVDEPRYITFQDKRKNPVSIVYPDAFSVKSFDDLTAKLHELEAKLNALSIDQSVCNGCLTGLISAAAEQVSEADHETIINRANQFKLADAISWKDLDIDSRHVYIAENYLDSAHTAFVNPEKEKGYEISYFNGEGDSQGYDLGFNSELLASATPLVEVEKPYADDPNNPFDDPPPQQQGGYDLFTWNPPPVSPWYERVKEWYADLKNNTSFTVSFGEEKQKNSENQAKELEAEKQKIKDEANAFVSSPEDADKIVLSRVKKIRITADSTAAVVGKKVTFGVDLLDENDALVSTEFNRVDVTVDNGATVMDNDEDPTADGTQRTVIGGHADVSFIAPVNPAAVTVTVKMNSQPDIGKTQQFAILKSATIALGIAQTAIVADGRGLIPVTLSAVDDKGSLLANVNGTVHIALSDDSLARATKEVQLVRGRAQFTVRAGVKKGELIINAATSNLDPAAATIKFLPGPAVKLVLVKNADVLIANPGESIDVTAQIFDAYNNLIDTNTGTPISFVLNDSAVDIAELTSLTANTVDGLATVRVLPKGKSGSISVTAKTRGLRDAILTLNVVKKFGTGSLSRINPESLVTALLGIPAGNVSAPKAFGSSMVFAGKNEAVTTLTTSPKQYSKVFEVSDKGALTSDPDRVSVSFVPGNHLAFLMRDTRYGIDLAKIYVITKKDGQFALTDEQSPEKLSDGIYLHATSSDPSYVFDKSRGSLRISKSDEERIEVQTNGFVKVYDQNFTVRPKKSDYLTLEILEGQTVVAEVYIVQRFNQDVRTYSNTGDISNDAAGVYVQPFALPGTFFFEPSFSGNTTSASLGMALKDRSQVLDGAGSPGFGYNSFEDSLDSMGVGFTQDNKFALLFSAGEIFGEANRQYMSDATIVLGDPTVRLNNAPHEDNFSIDVGTLLYSATSDVRGLLSFDVNSDGFEDLLVVQQDGLIKYIQNGGGVNNFTDRGTLLNIKNGIQDFTKVDINGDGQQDIVVAAKNGCTVDSTCIDIFLNNRGSFTRQNVTFDQTEKITAIKASDMNGDNKVDLVFTDTAGDISLLLNHGDSFANHRVVIGNVGLKTEPGKNVIANTLVRYAGILERNPDGPQNETEAKNQQFYMPVELSVANPDSHANDSGIDAVNPILKISQDFMYADAPISSLKTSTKYAQDVNGDVLRNGDIVRYTLTLKNTGNSPLSRVAVIDVVASQVLVKNDSISCTNCEHGEMKIDELKDDPERPFMFSNITIPANSNRVITYEGTYTQSADESEKVIMVLSPNFTDSTHRIQGELSADTLPDISINKEGNTSGQVQYFISKKENGRVTYVEEKSTLEPDSNVASISASIAAMASSFAGASTGNENSLPPELTNKFNDFKSGDKDGDGLQDTLDDINGKLEKVGDGVEKAMNKLTCAAGCIPMPLNVAAFAPGFFSVMGLPGAFDIGLPAFGWGVPNLIPTWPPSPPAQSALGGRFYISPTLTGGIGFGLCLGPYGTPKNCYAFGLNPLDLLPGNICDKIGGGLNKLIAKANSVAAKANEGITAAISPKKGSVSRGGTGLVSYSMGSYEPPVPHKKNSRVPGFPSFITDWFSAQIEEFIDKATDMPDIYVIYPKITSIAQSFLPTEAFNRTSDPINNILSWVNSIPLIDIQSSEVNFKVPIITEKEIMKVKIDALQWVEDEKYELDRWKQMMLCGIPLSGNKDVQNNQRDQFINVDICHIVDLQMNQLITSIVENTKRLDEWVLFPKKVLQYRTVKTYYVNQIVDYLNTVIEFVGGWAKRNTAIVERWRKSIREMKDVIEHYKLIIKLSMDANASCDLCKTERYGLDELILKIFAAIPKPPVIPLPRLPDFVIDVSKIQAGVTIQWPDITFAPEPLIIPKIPRIHLGVNLTIPNFKLMLPAIPLLPAPPDLPDLPPLPPLKLGKLPDLPPAPTLPDLPASLQATLRLLSQLYRIYCIIKLGFTPVDEVFLKTRIEQITARGLTPVLPIDMLLAFPGPSIKVTYIDQIVVTAFLNLRTDMTFIQKAVEAVAAKSNKFTNEFVSKINKFTENLAKTIEQYTSPTFNVNVNANGDTSVNGKKVNYVSPAENNVPQSVKDALNKKDKYGDVLSKVFGENINNVDDAHSKLAGIFSNLSKEQREYQAKLDKIPEKYVLTAEPVTLEEAKISLKNDGVNSNIDDVRLLAEESPTLKQIVAYRDELSKYAQGTSSDTLSLSQLIAESSPSTPQSPFSKLTASLNTPQISDEPEKVSSMVNNLDGNKIAQVPPVPGADMAQGSDALDGSVNNVGIFYQDSHGENRRLLNYTLEADSSSFLETLDADHDGDNEKIYSYGRNVFIKENYSPAQNGHAREGYARRIFSGYDVEKTTVYDLLKGASAPRDVRVDSESAHDSTISFVVPEVQKSNIVGFDVTTHSTVDDAQINGLRTPKAVNRYTVNAAEKTSEAVNAQNNVVAVVESVEGLVKAKGEPVGNGTQLEKGIFVDVGKGASAVIKFNDGTRIEADENSGFTIPEGPAFELTKGKATLTLSEAPDLLKTSSAVTVSDGSLTVIMAGGSSAVVTSGGSLTIPALEVPKTILARVTDNAIINGGTREYISKADGQFHLNAGDKIHALSTAHVKWAIDDNDQHTYTLKNAILSVPESSVDGLNIAIEDGTIEIIHSTTIGVTAIRTGSALLDGEKVEVQTGAVVVESRVGELENGTLNDTDSRRSVLYAHQTLSVNSFDSLDGISLKIYADPAFYYARVTSIMADGSQSVSSATTLLAPQPCGDNTIPYANAGASEFTVAVGKELTIDASRSFDSNGKITGYQLDTDLSVDSNHDGDPQNDADQTHGADQTSFAVGPYSDAKDIRMMLTVFDEAHNAGKQSITINVVSPTIILDKEPLSNGDISGHIEPKEANVPIVIARLRKDGGAGWELIKTSSANQNGQYLTDNNGEFRITDSVQKEGLILYVADKEVALVNQKTGRITIIDQSYEVSALPAIAGKVPTRLSVFKKGDSADAKPYTFVYFVPDVNTDATIDSRDTEYTIGGVSFMSGVHVKPLAEADNQGISFKVLSGADPVNPGGVVIRDNANKQIALVDVNGDVLLNKDTLSLRVKEISDSAKSQDPVVFELLLQNKPIAEIFIATKNLGKDDVNIIKTPTLPLRPRPINKPNTSTANSQNSRQQPVEQPFADIQKGDPFNEIIKKLFVRGIVAGYATGTQGEFEFRPDQQIARSEFTQIVLKMLCIVPRPEAYRLPTPFYDVVDPRLWFYAVLKEGNIRGFIKGYVGEARRDKTTGNVLTPFKPASSITRAEAVTVVIAALDEEKIIDLSRADLRAHAGEQWYDPYLRVAVNLTPYLTRAEDAALQPFLLTRDEALRPTELITRRDFALIADRVLLLRDCGAPAVSQADEQVAPADNGQNNPSDVSANGQSQVPDNAQQNNENANNVAQNEVIPVDNKEGIFIVDTGCANECPCRVRIAPAADMSSGDTIFAAIAGPNGVPIYAKSNEEKYP